MAVISSLLLTLGLAMVILSLVGGVISSPKGASVSKPVKQKIPGAPKPRGKFFKNIAKRLRRHNKQAVQQPAAAPTEQVNSTIDATKNELTNLIDEKFKAIEHIVGSQTNELKALERQFDVVVSNRLDALRIELNNEITNLPISLQASVQSYLKEGITQLEDKVNKTLNAGNTEIKAELSKLKEGSSNSEELIKRCVKENVTDEINKVNGLINHTKTEVKGYVAKLEEQQKNSIAELIRYCNVLDDKLKKVKTKIDEKDFTELKEQLELIVKQLKIPTVDTDKIKEQLQLIYKLLPSAQTPAYILPSHQLPSAPAQPAPLSTQPAQPATHRLPALFYQPRQVIPKSVQATIHSKIPTLPVYTINFSDKKYQELISVWRRQPTIWGFNQIIKTKGISYASMILTELSIKTLIKFVTPFSKKNDIAADILSDANTLLKRVGRLSRLVTKITKNEGPLDDDDKRLIKIWEDMICALDDGFQKKIFEPAPTAPPHLAPKPAQPATAAPSTSKKVQTPAVFRAADNASNIIRKGQSYNYVINNSANKDIANTLTNKLNELSGIVNNMIETSKGIIPTTETDAIIKDMEIIRYKAAFIGTYLKLLEFCESLTDDGIKQQIVAMINRDYKAMFKTESINLLKKRYGQLTTFYKSCKDKISTTSPPSPAPPATTSNKAKQIQNK